MCRRSKARTLLLVKYAGFLVADDFLKGLDGLDCALVVIAARRAFVMAEPGEVGLDSKTFRLRNGRIGGGRWTREPVFSLGSDLRCRNEPV